MAVLEAGLGGRYDATNVVDSACRRADQRRPRAHALARPDGRRYRAGEARRRAPGRDARARVSDLDPGALAVARERWRERGATPRGGADGAVDIELRAGGGFQRRNFAARALRRPASTCGRGPSRERARRCGAAAATSCRDASQVLEGRPADAARRRAQPAGVAALAESLPSFSAPAARWLPSSRSSTTRTPRGCCRGCSRTLRCRGLHGRHEPARAAAGRRCLARSAQIGGRRRRASCSNRAERSRGRASWAGEDGVVLATGSIYLIGDLLRAEDAGGGSAL